MSSPGKGSSRPRASSHRIADASPRGRVRVTGTVEATETVPHGSGVACRVVIADGSGELDCLFLGRGEIAGITAGTCMIVEGTVQPRTDRIALWNPRYELLGQVAGKSVAGGRDGSNTADQGALEPERRGEPTRQGR